MRLKILIFIAAFLLWFGAAKTLKDAAPPETATVAATSTPVRTLSHEQEVWLYALEWCESRGVPTAINEVDRDGTPSYYSFQFKPDTFRLFGERYGVIELGLTNPKVMELLKRYDLQRAILTQMLLHYDEIEWKNQFPDCIMQKIGMPPQ